MARIVIAEDSVHIRNVLSMWLSRNGHEVRSATDGRAALACLQEIPADLLITDVNMPEMDGIALAGAAFDVCPTLRWVFLVSSRCDQEEMLAQLACRARVSLFPKPFSPSHLLSEVARVTAEQVAGAAVAPDVAAAARGGE
jgi:two-component system chemotaxis response regulator CheY